MRWFEQHRMEWIAEILRVFGYINREHLMRKFGLSAPSAERFSGIPKLRPGVMEYDKSAKCYVAKPTQRHRGKGGHNDFLPFNEGTIFGRILAMANCRWQDMLLCRPRAR